MNWKIDALDRAIMKMLQKNATLPYKQIGRELNKSEATICNRVNKLVKMNVITGIVAQLDPAQLNLQSIGCIHLKSNSPKEKLKAELITIRGLRSCTSITGSSNIRVNIAAENAKAFAKIADTIARIPNVEVVDTSFDLDEIIPDRGFDF